MFRRQSPAPRQIAGLVVDYQPRRDRRQKRIRLRLVPGRVVVSFPAGTRLAAVDRFIDDHAAWIAARAQPLPAYRDGQILAQNWRLLIEPGRSRRQIGGGQLRVGDDRQKIEAGIKALLKQLAQEVIEPRAKELAASTGLGEPAGWRLAYFNSCWGNCRWQTKSGPGVIALNTALANLPGRLVDLVIVHELCHLKLRQSGHGPDFWQLLESHQPGAKDLSRRLSRDFRPGLLPATAVAGAGLGLVD